MKKYDVIIAGASFAGLAVASRINGKILLIDRKEIGTGQTSACGTTLDIVKGVGCKESILQTFNKASLHTENNKRDILLPEKYCTIDYGKFCKLFNKQNNAEFIKTNALRLEKSRVLTNKGSFKADIIVDCTGWQAVLASSLKKSYVNKKMLSFGIETEIPYKRDYRLRFFINPNIIKNGAAWLFPCRKKARFGIGSYSGNTKLLGNLKRFVESYNRKIGKIHGGYFCYCLKKPVVKNIFVVGCAAGQTLPLTGEGIRRSTYFGLICGKIIQKILNKEISLKKGQEKYKRIALKYDNRYQLMLSTQKSLPKMANWEINLIAKLLSMKPISNLIFDWYEKI